MQVFYVKLCILFFNFVIVNKRRSTRANSPTSLVKNQQKSFGVVTIKIYSFDVRTLDNIKGIIYRACLVSRRTPHN